MQILSWENFSSFGFYGLALVLAKPNVLKCAVGFQACG
jgi:hypothetical protein